MVLDTYCLIPRFHTLCRDNRLGRAWPKLATDLLAFPYHNRQTSRVSIILWAMRLTFSASSVAWMAFIFWASSLPPEEVDQSLQGLAGLGLLRSILGHLALYGILAALMHICLWSWRPAAGRSLWWAMATLALAVLYGVSDELHQAQVPGREPSALDVLTDGAGAMMGIMMVKYLAAGVSHWLRLAGRPFSRFEPEE